MTGRTNTGGVSLRAYAHIVAEYFAGSVVTVTNTRKQVVLSDTLSIFLVEDGATSCVATATYGGTSRSMTFAITEGGSYYANLETYTYLIKSGVLQTAAMITAGKSEDGTGGTAAPDVSAESGYYFIGFSSSANPAKYGIAYFPSQINLALYTKLHVEGWTKNGTVTPTNGAVDAWTSIGSSQSANRLFRRQTQSGQNSSYTSMSLDIDISSLTSMAYVGFNMSKTSAGYTSLRITDMYLER